MEEALFGDPLQWKCWNEEEEEKVWPVAPFMRVYSPIPVL
jgi:hypothetical protein